MKTVLDLDYKRAKRFFLNEKNYFTGDLPLYFTFQKVINEADSILHRLGFKNVYTNLPCKQPNLNYDIFINKDGAYDWRKLTIINPILYVNIVNSICNESAWEFIRERFGSFRKNTNIICSSLPVVPSVGKRQKAQQIDNWITNFEKDSATLALSFSNMCSTDIVNCYSSLYTHTIAWALHGEDVCKRRKNDEGLLGNIIDKGVRDCTYNQTNGIPQGSVLMDFIAEIVLGDIDLQLTQRIQEEQITDYKILRYRDDYRVFTNSQKDGETILKIINDVCLHMGLRMNSNKTFSTSDIILNSIKKDKFVMPLDLKQKDLYKILLCLYKLSIDFQKNAGIQTQITHINKKLQKEFNKKKYKGQEGLFISIMADIAYNIPKAIPQAFTTISQILKNVSEEEQLKYIEKIKTKFSKKVNTSFACIWLQRLSAVLDKTIYYEPKLCRILSGVEESLWDFSWLKKGVADQLESCELIDHKKIKRLKLPISSKETNIFEY